MEKCTQIILSQLEMFQSICFGESFPNDIWNSEKEHWKIFGPDVFSCTSTSGLWRELKYMYSFFPAIFYQAFFEDDQSLYIYFLCIWYFWIS